MRFQWRISCKARDFGRGLEQPRISELGTGSSKNLRPRNRGVGPSKHLVAGFDLQTVTSGYTIHQEVLRFLVPWGSDSFHRYPNESTSPLSPTQSNEGSIQKASTEPMCSAYVLACGIPDLVSSDYQLQALSQNTGVDFRKYHDWAVANDALTRLPDLNPIGWKLNMVVASRTNF